MKLILALLISLPLTAGAYNNVLKPKTTKEFQRTSVRVTNLEQNSGGTGSIFRSSKKGSEILTNKHVCRLIEQGGIVEREGKRYLIAAYKKFPKHDLCLVKIRENLKVNLVLSKTPVKQSDTTFISGHPSLLPHIVNKGHLSGNMDIQLLAGLKKCSKIDKITDAVKCSWFGGKPIIEVMNADVTSNLIKPGSSGSAVFNDKGEIIGVAFAGSGRGFSYGFIVPQLDVAFFLKTKNLYSYVKVGTKNPLDEVFSERTFNFSKCEKIKDEEDPKYNEIKDICSKLRTDLIWRK